MTVGAAWLWAGGYGLALMMPDLPWAWYVWGGSLLLAVVFQLAKLQGKGAVLGLLALWSAFVYYQAYDGLNRSHAVEDGISMETYDGKTAVLRGKLASTVDVDGDRASFVMKVSGWAWEGADELRPNEQVQVNVRLTEQEQQGIARQWKRGDRIIVEATMKLPGEARNFGDFDYRTYLRRQHIHWTASVKGTEGIMVSPSGPWQPDRLLRWNDLLRERTASELERLFPGEEAGYMKGLLIGLREDLDPELYRQFSRLGLTHILAISGMQVAVFTGVFLGIFRLLRVTRETSLTATMCLIPLYVLFTGSSPSVVRAGLTAMAALFAARIRWLKDGQQLLGGAAIAMLVWNPYYITDVGFQLSFLVTYGLMVGVAPVSKLLPVRNRTVKGALAVALTAQLVSFPLTVYYFNQFSLLSLPANVVLVPLIGFLVTPLGTTALAVSPVFPAGGHALAVPASWLNRLSFWAVDRMAGGFGGLFQLVWPKPAAVWVIGYYGLLAAVLSCLWKRDRALTYEKEGIRLLADGPRRLARLSMAAGGLAVLWLCWCVFAYAPDRWIRGSEGEVHFLDVGQGDAAYIRTPEGKRLLLDGGGTFAYRKQGEEWKERRDPYEIGRKTIVPLLKRRGVHRLDYMVISHEDADHIGGLQAVLEEIPVGAIVFNGTVKSGPYAEKLLRTALEKRIPLIPAYQGQSLRVDKHTHIEVLSPFREEGSGIVRAEKQNGETLVCVLSMFGSRMLFAGDIDSGMEREILERLSDAPGSPAGRVPKGAAECSPDVQGCGNTSWETEKTAPVGDTPAGRVAAVFSAIDVLKVAHHGSQGSTSEEWLHYWKPKLAVISVGAHNVYGHPGAGTLERLKSAGSAVVRTDLNGEIQLSVRPGGLYMRTKLLQAD